LVPATSFTCRHLQRFTIQKVEFAAAAGERFAF